MELMEPGVKFLAETQYKQTEAGKIPVDWHIRKLAEVAEIRTGIAKNTGAELSNPTELPYLRVANVQDGFLDLKEVSQIRMNRNEVKRYLLQPGDVLMNEGGDLDKLGRGAIWQGQISPCVHQNHVFAVRCKAELIPEFLNAWTSSSPARRYFMLAGRQTTNLASINKTALGQLPVPIPSSTAEQRAIAKALTDIDLLVTTLEQSLHKKHLLKQGAMEELLTGRKRLSGFTGTWRKKQWGDVIAQCSSGATPLRSHTDFFTGPIKWITSTELKYNTIIDTSEHISLEAVKATNLTIHPSGTFLMAITGLEAAGTRGACAITGVPAATNQSCMAIYPSQELSTHYLYHYYVLKGDELALKYCQGTKQQSYTAGLIRILPIDLPPTIEEQTAIVSILTKMDAEASELNKKLLKTRHLKQAMMQELLTGMIRLV